MSQIPSDIAAAAAPSGFQAQEIAKDREAHRAGQAHAATRQVKTVTDAGSTVETGDADTAVFSDAEGQGGQGRPFEEEPKAPPDDEPAAGAGITTDTDGRLHIDLEA